jgi:hypothetical protein
MVVLWALGFTAACKPKPKTAADVAFDADAKSGPDAKRSQARAIPVNTAITDEVSYLGQDRTDWYQVTLFGKSGVMKTVLHWDSETSDVMIDVYDEVGRNISNSPVRDGKAKEKQLLTQIDKPGVYYVRVTAPSRADATVYTMEVKWEQPAPKVEVVPPPVEEPRPHHHARVEPPPKPAGETVQGHIVQAYLDGGALTLHLDKGAAAGLRAGMSGSVLMGASGEDLLEGGSFRIVQVLDANKSVARTGLRSVGRNTRVVINLGTR